MRMRLSHVLVLSAIVGSMASQAGPGGAASGHAERVPFIVQFERPPVLLSTELGVMGRHGDARAKADLRSPEVDAYRALLASEREAAISHAQAQFGRRLDVEAAFELTLNAATLRLTADEAVRLARMPGIASVDLEEVYHPLTDAGPKWIGAENIWNGTATGVSARGQGVVVGIVDTGINPTHPSFAESASGFTHTNPRGQFYGLCQGSSTAGCNAKLIGIWDKTTGGSEDKEANDGTDKDGHGSHVASTAAGNPVQVSLSTGTGPATVTLSGVAPRANIISYKACEVDSACRGTWTLASIEQAVADGVDVINYSISSGTSGAWNDTVSRAMLAAREAGIVVVASAGNNGPSASTIRSIGSAPWVLSVAASTHDRQLANRVFLSGGNAPLPGGGVLYGAGRTAGTGDLPMVRANPALCAEGSDVNNTTGANKPASWNFGTFFGQMVLCDRGIYARVAKSYNVGISGGAAMLLLNQASDGSSTVADQHSIPASHLTYVDSQALLAWLSSGSGHRARLEGEKLLSNPSAADQLASFSSRGPGLTPDILKPDVTAPGVSILAASQSGSNFHYSSGTSMSGPHVAGAAALIKSARNNWSAEQIVSALISTSVGGVRKEDGVTDATPLDTGAGRVDLLKAARAALFFPEITAASGFQGFRQADPGQSGDPAKINYPTIALSRCVGTCTARREVRDLAGGGSWSVEVTAPANVAVSVSPTQFTLAAGASQLLEVTVTPTTSARSFEWVHGQIRLRRTTSDGRSDAVIPLVVRPTPPNRAPVATTDYFTVEPGQVLVVPGPGLIGNDFDPDSDTFQFRSYRQPAGGTLSSVFSSGGFTYTPSIGFSGNDSFDYQICDSSNLCTWGVANVRVSSQPEQHNVWYMTRASNTAQQGFARIVNLSGQSGSVEVYGIDDAGQRSTGTMTFSLPAFAAQQFNSQDLENGNVDKGLNGSLGPGTGDWRLVVSSRLKLQVQSLLRTPDGFLTAVHSASPLVGGNIVVPMVNPGRNTSQASWLRFVNPTEQPVTLQITARDDAGNAGSGQVSLSLPARRSIEISAADLENGNAAKGLAGQLGAGEGKWRITVSGSTQVKVLSLLRDPKGYLTNLSTLADQTGQSSGQLVLHMMPRGSNTAQQGFIRTVNRAGAPESVTVTATDDEGSQAAGSLGFTMQARAAQQFNSQDLEQGSPGKGLAGSVTPGTGDWRLRLATGGNSDVQSLIRTPDGFLTTIHDLSSQVDGLVQVAVFNPASNTSQVSKLRLVNDNGSTALVTLVGIDDAGARGRAPVMLSLPARSSIEISATDLEQGNVGKGLAGSIGTGTGKWRLQVWSSVPVHAMSLLYDPKGYLTNLSSIVN